LLVVVLLAGGVPSVCVPGVFVVSVLGEDLVEAAPGPHDASGLFGEFCALMEGAR